jgi:hypothetical protein
MKEFAKSFASLSLGMSILGFQLLGQLLTPNEEDEPKGPATRALDSVTDATVDQLGPTLRATFRALDNVQRGLTAVAFNSLLPFAHDDSNELSYETGTQPVPAWSIDRRTATSERNQARTAGEKNSPVAIKIRRQW